MTRSCTSELVPSTSTRSPQRLSWRRTVAHAVALARRAVELDMKNTDPMGALAAYTESVRLLRSILARLERHGACSEASQLASINEKYCERMRLLCVACAVPPPPYDDHPPSELNGSSSPTLAPPSALPPPPAYDELSYSHHGRRILANLNHSPARGSEKGIYGVPTELHGGIVPHPREREKPLL
ncbi:hypothetical protein BJV77DRAFT_1067431 [Russula vinacea]|nr:hypothetical protein BJV77DRAFT_1067431 [Russula vinacea]